jgi:hypothetical protein
MNTKTKNDHQAARWDELKAHYPEAGHWFNEGWHYGSLRHQDQMIRKPTLEELIDALLERETDDRKARA